MGRHHAAPARRARRITAAALATAGLTLTGTGTAWACADNPDTTTECGAMEPGDAVIAAPVCAPIHLTAPATATADLPVLHAGGLVSNLLGG